MILRNKTLHLVHLHSFFFTFHMKTPLPPLHKLGLSFLLIIGQATAAMADAGVVHRNRCYWVTKKYVAEAKGKVCGDIQREFARDRGCNWAESWVELYGCTSNLGVRKGEGTPYSPSPGNGNPFQAVLGTAQARIDGNSARTYSWGGYGSYSYYDRYAGYLCTGTGYVCMGETGKLLYPASAPALAPLEPNQSFRSASIDAGDRSYDPVSRIMTISNFRATLRNNPYDKENEFSALHLSVLRSSDNVQDSLNHHNDDEYLQNLLVASRVMLRNGKLTIDGALQKATVVTSDSAGYQIARITVPEVQLQVPTGVEPDDVTLSMGSDVGILAQGVSVRYLPGNESTVYNVADSFTSNEVLEFSSYPNPAVSGTGTVTVDAKITQAETVTIGLYREDNTLVRPVYSGVLAARTRRSFPINLQGVAPGTYYLRLVRRTSQLTRRVVVR